MPRRESVWPLLPIGELLTRVVRPVDVDQTQTYREIGIRSHCKGIFHKPPVTGEEIGDKRVFWVEPGCLVFNIIFAWEQAVAITSDAENGMIASHRFPMYRARNGKMLPDYARLYFSSPRGKYELNIASPGGAGRNKTLGQEEFKRMKVPVPPLDHQQFTVDAIATWDKSIAHVQSLIDSCRRRKQGLAKRLLSESVRLAGFEKPWQVHQLGDITTLIFSNVDKLSEPGETPVFLCNYTDVYYNDLITPELKFMEATASAAEIAKFSLKKGDVVITKDSETPDDIAKPAVVTDDMPGVVCGYHLAIVRPKTGAHGPFLAQLFRLPRIRHEFMKISNGVTRFGLGQSSLRKMHLRMPELKEQKQIADVLGTADREVALLERKLLALQTQKKAMMQQLLSGKSHQHTPAKNGGKP